ncbi:proteinase-activated receptor 2 [Chanos chanos]|uniref:Proteinase-activated receptor 2 n=1 Tax=Chanos chanos TaxID=29144 RepID=A0A6J2UTH5_CHACN|nr:proteinase-activated receptor 2-like [Chanos chanos]
MISKELKWDNPKIALAVNHFPRYLKKFKPSQKLLVQFYSLTESVFPPCTVVWFGPCLNTCNCKLQHFMRCAEKITRRQLHPAADLCYLRTSKTAGRIVADTPHPHMPPLRKEAGGKTRGYIGEETNEGVKVPPMAEMVLTGHLTTVFLPIVYIVVFAVGLPTNAMAIWVFLFRTKKKHPGSIFMANLALSDLLFVVWIPLKIAYHFNKNNWIYGEALCKVLVAFFYGNMYCSAIFIACISVQRYWAVVHPLSHRRRDNKIAIGISVSVWLVVWLLTIPLYSYDQTVRATNLDILTCHDITRTSQAKIPAGYFLTMGILGFVIPAVVCVVAYIQMLKSLRCSMTTEDISKKRQKAVILIITVLVMFLLCFAPSNIMLFVHYSLLLNNVKNNAYGFYITTLCLASLNSCVDPFVYYFISEDFRDHVKNMLKCRSERTAERMRVSFSALKYSKKTSTYTSDSNNTQSSSC